MERQNNEERYEVYTKMVTITESKRVDDSLDSSKAFEKHKIFLYKEDFEKFNIGLAETLECIKTIQETGQLPE